MVIEAMGTERGVKKVYTDNRNEGACMTRRRD